IRRRRECLRCGRRFTTYERIETLNVLVIKKDGRREIFDKQKIINGIMKACEKRPVSYSQIEGIANEIENTIRQEGLKEVESRWIGDFIMERLKEMDRVAYIRFASVYKEFKDISDFERELKQLLRRGNGDG
ncbi:MAG: transcriptional repressor NrdR, partial [Candidatus Odinarchaeota archaeon]|nr:transcriptional repressor NrdR [Candidatus Odinarchaeota archaeon]